MTTKTKANKSATATATASKATTNKAAPKAQAVDWNAESARAIASAKEKPGSRGDALGKVAQFVAGDTAGAALLRERCGEAGAQPLIDAPRNVLAKITKLANLMATGQPWCSLEGLQPEARRKEDASVAVALGSLGAGNDRQKAVIAEAQARYPGGANAQMPASLDACVIMGIVARDGSARNASYRLIDKAAADKLIPRA